LLLAAGIVIAIVALVVLPISKLLTKDSYKRLVYHYSMTITNYGYIGYALAGAIFGETSKELQDVMTFAFTVSIYTYTIGYSTLTGGKLSAKKLINPVTIAMVVGAVVGMFGPGLLGLINTAFAGAPGLVSFANTVPSVVKDFLGKASACMSPVSMLLAGVVISDYKFRDMLSQWQCYIIAALRLLIIPIVSCFALKLLGFEELVLPALMVLAMPCGMNTIVFPKLVGQDCKPGAAMAFITTLLCIVTIPICMFVLGISLG
jgi:predicted permease